MSRPRDWYDMTYEQQQEWVRHERAHQDELDRVADERRQLEQDADNERDRHRRHMNGLRAEMTCLVEGLDGQKTVLLAALKNIAMGLTNGQIERGETFQTIAQAAIRQVEGEGSP